MGSKLLAQTIATLMLAASVAPAIAAPPPPNSLSGTPAADTASQYGIRITPNTRYVNVQGGDVVRFMSGDKSFTWNFDGRRPTLKLSEIAPDGFLDREVNVYISPNPLYFGD
jgi:hypothetical protein